MHVIATGYTCVFHPPSLPHILGLGISPGLMTGRRAVQGVLTGLSQDTGAKWPPPGRTYGFLRPQPLVRSLLKRLPSCRVSQGLAL